MSVQRADAVVCGAGIAGIAAAYHLSARRGFDRVVLLDREPPLSVTSDKSTECYRNWWPAPGTDMVDLVTDSIVQLEQLARESGNRFNMNRRGYLFVTSEQSQIEEFAVAAAGGADRGVGPLREHPTGASGSYRAARECAFDESIDGCDLITDRALIRREFPCLSADIRAALHVQRCGWMSAQQLGAYLLEVARGRGVSLVRASLTEVLMRGQAVAGIVALAADGERLSIDAPVLVNAAGPFFGQLGELMGLTLPVTCEPHVKVSFDDRVTAIDREAPLLIGSDAVHLLWSAEEREILAQNDEGRALLAPYPAGVHGRPDGAGHTVLLYWTYHIERSEPVFPIPYDPAYPEIVLRGMAALVPGLDAYFGRIPNGYVDGGYYAKTEENRPLVGPLPVAGAYAMGAFSGFGIMSALGAGKLLAQHVAGEALPGFAPAFELARYDRPGYQALLANWPDSGQL